MLIKVFFFLSLVSISKPYYPYVKFNRNRSALNKRASNDLNDVTFWLYSNKNEPEIIKLDNIEKTTFNPHIRTIIFIHGFGTSSKEFCPQFVKAYSWVNVTANFLCVNWSKLASIYDYISASENAIKVGLHSGEFVGKLIEKFKLDSKNISVMGHSLGAHSAGHLGRKIQQLGFSKLDRITGFDPAGPLFEQDFKNQININDAKFVDVIHTNSGDFIDGCMSIEKPLGHIDYYPNGGNRQPGCNKCKTKCIKNTICNHSRSYLYFIEFVKNGFKGFKSRRCDSWNNFVKGNCYNNEVLQLGERKFKVPGKYYLFTNANSPFSK